MKQPGKCLLKSLVRQELSACNDAESFLQSGFWGGFKARFGWEALAFKVEWEDMPNPGPVSLLVLWRKLAPLFAFAYIPWGPALPDDFPCREKAVAELAISLKELLPANIAFIRFDIPWQRNLPPQTSSSNDALPCPPFSRSASNVQAPDTVLLNLQQSMDSLIAGMKPKWRYNSRLALKKGVTIKQALPDQLGNFYALLKETAERDGLAIHGFAYYRDLFESAWYSGLKPDIRLYLAEHEGDLIAGIVTLFWKHEAVYLYGASSNNKRNLMAPYALQLRAMEDAKNSGCLEYDLYGVPPDNDPSHPMHGLYLFKTGFGGTLFHRAGCWDYPCRPFTYRIFCYMEAFRKKLLARKKQRHRQN